MLFLSARSNSPALHPARHEQIGAAITDTALLSACGKLIIVVLGGFVPSFKHLLLIAGVGISIVGGTNDMLADYQTAYLLGTSPKSMFYGQVFGASLAVFVTPLSYSLLKKAFDISLDGSFTAPGALALRSLGVLFTQGFDILPKNSGYFIAALSSAALI